MVSLLLLVCYIFVSSIDNADFAKGMYNTPSFTLARTIGGLISLWWRRWKGRSETPIVVLASGLILGEGLFSIVNLVLASLKVPHL